MLSRFERCNSYFLVLRCCVSACVAQVILCWGFLPSRDIFQREIPLLLYNFVIWQLNTVFGSHIPRVFGRRRGALPEGGRSFLDMASEITYAEVRFKNESNSSGPYSDSATGKKYSGLNVGGKMKEGWCWLLILWVLLTGFWLELQWVELFAEWL